MKKRVWPSHIANFFILSFVATLGAANVSGQTRLSEMYHRSWTARDGAPNDITAMAQGADGFLWLATEDGLFRFDGVTFNRFQPPNGSVFLSNRMFDILATPDGSLWLTYTLGGVTRIKNNTVTNFTDREGLRGSHFPNFALEKDGTVWIAGTRGLEFIRDSRVYRFEDQSGIASTLDESIVVDRGGNIWINPKSRLMVLPRGAKDFLPASSDAFYGCNAAHDEGILCRSSTKPLTHFVLSDSKITSRPLVRPPSNYWDTLGANDGSLWIATDRNGIERIPSEAGSRETVVKPEFFGRKDGLTSDRVISSVEDREGSVWVLTDRGIDQFRAVPFHALELDVPTVTLPSNDVGGPFLIATNRLEELKQDGLHDLSPARPVPGEAGCIYSADDGSIWAWVGDQLLRYAHGSLETIPLPDATKFGRVQTIVEDAQHAMWVSSSRDGLYRWNSKQWVRRGGYADLPDDVAYVALRERDGDLWFGFRNSILVRLSSGKSTVYNVSSGLDLGDLRTLVEHDGRIWIGGERGVAIFDHGRFRPLVLRGLRLLNGVSGLVFTQNGDLWINSSSGVFQVSNDELSKRDVDSDYLAASREFNYLDGIDGIPSTTSGNPSAALGADGKLYLATNRRVQWIDPLHLVTNLMPPTVWITNVRTAGQSHPTASSSMRLAADTRNVEISYTATSLLIPERVRFRYRLAGFDSDWIDAGTRREAFYAKLPPGQYTFEVKACNDSGIWSPAATSIVLIIPPTFMESVWFKFGSLLVALVVVFLIFRIRLNLTKRRLANQMYEILSERQRIARDLHDMLLQGVQALMFKVAIATKKLPMEEPVRPILEETVAQSDQVLLEGRKLIANLQMTEEPSGALLDSLWMIGEELRDAYPSTQFLVEAQGSERLLSTIVNPELRNIGREALTNAFRHAEATQVRLTVQATPQELRLSVLDDGRGIDAEVLVRGYRSGHWGLRNMRERARRLGGRLTLTSSPRGGTTVQVSVPAFVAYQDAPRGFLEQISRWLR